jgi:hypothetical protein
MNAGKLAPCEEEYEMAPTRELGGTIEYAHSFRRQRRRGLVVCVDGNLASVLDN